MICENCHKPTDKRLRKGLCFSCYNSLYYQTNKSYMLAEARKWYDKNKEKKKEYDRKYRPRKPKEEWKHKSSYKGPCRQCGKIDQKCRYIKKFCRSCYRKIEYRKSKPIIMRYCSNCRKKLSKFTKKEKCTVCWRREQYSSNEIYKSKRTEENHRYRHSEKGKISGTFHVLKRRSQFAKVENTLTNKEWQEILARFNYCCAYCGSHEKLEKDHVVPISKGGATTKNNIVPACRKCNSSKGAKILK